MKLANPPACTVMISLIAPTRGVVLQKFYRCDFFSERRQNISSVQIALKLVSKARVAIKSDQHCTIIYRASSEQCGRRYGQSKQRLSSSLEVQEERDYRVGDHRRRRSGEIGGSTKKAAVFGDRASIGAAVTTGGWEADRPGQSSSLEIAEGKRLRRGSEKQRRSDGRLRQLAASHTPDLSCFVTQSAVLLASRLTARSFTWCQCRLMESRDKSSTITCKSH